MNADKRCGNGSSLTDDEKETLYYVLQDYVENLETEDDTGMSIIQMKRIMEKLDLREN